MNEKGAQILEAASTLGNDVIFLNGTIDAFTFQHVASELSGKSLSSRALLILVTYGGDPDGAFRLGRFLQKAYSDGYTILVPGLCKSAGTLVALGSREIVMAITGELGPLDIQIAKEDDFMARQSGLDMLHGIHNLIEHSFLAFERFFLQILAKSGGSITTRTASKIATDLVVGLFSPAFNQIEPVRLGALARANRIGMEYAIRLGAPLEVAQRLVNQYPSHSFSIDLQEATALFTQSKPVREPNESELTLLNALTSSGFALEIPNTTSAVPRVWLAAPAHQQNAVKLKGSDGDGKTKATKPKRTKGAPRAPAEGEHEARTGGAS